MVINEVRDNETIRYEKWNGAEFLFDAEIFLQSLNWKTIDIFRISKNEAKKCPIQNTVELKRAIESLDLT